MSNLRQMLKKSKVFFAVLISILIIVALYKAVTRTKNTNQPVVTTNAKKGNAPVPIVEAQPSAPPQPIQQSFSDSPSPKPDPVKNFAVSLSTNMEALTDPFCLNGAQDFAAIPNFYLAAFYTNRNFNILLPKRYADCFTSGKTMNIIFYEFSDSLKLPLKPLVSATLRVGQRTEISGLSKIADPWDIRDSSAKELMTETGNFFAIEKTEPFVLINLDRVNIDDHPNFWPVTPSVHPVATFVSKSRGDELLNLKDLIAIDARSKKDQKQYPFKKASTTLNFIDVNKNSHLLNLSQLMHTKKKYFVGKKQSTSFLIIGAHENDWGALNVANYLMGYGYKNIYITDPKSYGSILGSWNRPPVRVTSLTVDELKALRDRKEKFLLIDARFPRARRSTIQDAYPLPYKIVSVDPKGNPSYAFDVDALKNYIGNSTSKVIVYGKSDIDISSLEIAQEISSLTKNTVLWVKGGYDLWSFSARYKWPDVKLSEIPMNLNRNSAPPPRTFRPGTSPMQKTVIKFESQKNDQSTPPSTPLTREQVDKLRKENLKKKGI